MDRSQKEAAVAELTDGLKDAEAIFAVDYSGISVTEAAELRGRLREADAVLKVVKNRLAKLAAADAGTTEIDELLVGPTALTLIKGDAVIAAKAIADFAREHSEVKLEYKGGIMDGAALDPESFKVIARLPGLDVLRGQLVGIAASPITGLVRGLGSMVSGLAIALGQIAEQGLVSGEAPEAEAPAAHDTPAGEPAQAPEAEAPAAHDTPAGKPAQETEAEAPAAQETPSDDAEEPAAEPEPEPEQTSDDEEGGGEENSPTPEADTDTEETSSEEVVAEGETSEDDEEE